MKMQKVFSILQMALQYLWFDTLNNPYEYKTEVAIMKHNAPTSMQWNKEANGRG